MNDEAPNVEYVDGSQKRPTRKRYWPALLIGGALIVVLAAVVLVPARMAANVTAMCHTCEWNMRLLALGLTNYRDVHRGYPTAYTVDASGKPMHSWRALILKYCDFPIHHQYNFDESWDSPYNQTLADKMPGELSCPFHESTSETSYFLVTKNGKVGECKLDGKRVLLIEVPDRRVNWLSPYGDVECDEIPAIRARIKEMGHPKGIGVVMVDGSFKRITE